jgi:hypothetical protein
VIFCDGFQGYVLVVMASGLFMVFYWFGGGMLQWCCNVVIVSLRWFVIVVYYGGLDICLSMVLEWHVLVVFSLSCSKIMMPSHLISMLNENLGDILK